MSKSTPLKSFSLFFLGAMFMALMPDVIQDALKDSLYKGFYRVYGSLFGLEKDDYIEPSSDPETHRSLYLGAPKRNKYPNSLKQLNHVGFVVAWDEKRKNPAWVAYRMSKPSHEIEDKIDTKYTQDKRINLNFDANAFKRANYDPTPLAPTKSMALCYGKRSSEHTGYNSNLVPMKVGLRFSLWKKLEHKIRESYVFLNQEVWVITGPIFNSSKTQLSNEREIPDAFYKIIIDHIEGRPQVLAFIMKQNTRYSDTLNSKLVSIDTIEKLTGLDFLSEISDDFEEELESKKPNKIW